MLLDCILELFSSSKFQLFNTVADGVVLVHVSILGTISCSMDTGSNTTKRKTFKHTFNVTLSQWVEVV